MRRLSVRGPYRFSLAIAGSVFLIVSYLGGVAYAASAGTASLSMTPCVKAGANPATITATITNKNTGTAGNKIGSIFLDATKAYFSNIQPVSAIVIQGRSDWTPHLETYGSGSDRNDLDGLYLTANNSTTAPLPGGSSITVSFPAKIGTSTGAKTWTGTAWTGTNLNGSKFSSFSTTVNVKTSCAGSLTFVTGPSSTAAGGVMSDVSVKVWDGANGTGNPVAGETVKLTSTGLAASPTAVTNASGIATFTGASQLTVGTVAAPNYTMTASDGSLTASALFNITAGAANTISFVNGPFPTAVGGVMDDVTVKVVDAYNNPVNADPVHLGSDGLATTPTPPVATDSSGEATFSGSQLTVINMAGQHSMIASDGVKSSAGANFMITSGSAANIEFVTGPSDTVAGGTMSDVKVMVTDQFDNPVQGDPVYLSSDGLDPDTTATVNTLADGTATFTGLTASSSADLYMMTAKDGSNESDPASFRVLPGDPATLTFTTQPTDTLVNDCIDNLGCGASGAVQVEALDSHGNDVADGTDITMSIGTDPTGTATLAGTFTNGTFNGVASFTDLAIDTTSSGYTLHAIWDGHPSVSVDSDEFAITNTNSSCGGQGQPACTATFDNGTSTVSAPAGTTLIIETNQLDCSGVQTPIAGTVTIIPSGNGVVPVAFTDTIPLPVSGPYPFCKTPPEPAVGTVPLCSTVNGLDQDPVNGVACVTESVEFTASQTTAILHSVLYIDQNDPHGKH